MLSSIAKQTGDLQLFYGVRAIDVCFARWSRINALDGVKPYIVRLCKYGIRSGRLGNYVIFCRRDTDNAQLLTFPVSTFYYVTTIGIT